MIAKAYAHLVQLSLVSKHKTKFLQVVTEQIIDEWLISYTSCSFWILYEHKDLGIWIDTVSSQTAIDKNELDLIKKMTKKELEYEQELKLFLKDQ